MAISSIPFELIKDKHVLIQAVVNDNDTLTLCFDTGATSSLIDESAAKRMGIEPNHEENVEGAGGSATYEIALDQKITIDKTELHNVPLIITDLTRLREALEHPFDGIIGYSLIENCITEIDFDNKVINLYPKTAKLDLDAYSQHRFVFGNDIPIPQLEVEIELENSKRYRGNVFFDSGAGLSLIVNTPFNQENELARQAAKTLTYKTENLNTQSISQEIAINHLKLGDYKFSDLPIGLEHAQSGVSSFEGYLGILGAVIINRFNFVVDYDKQMLYLKPNTLFNKPFEFPLTGLSLRKRGDGKIYIVNVSEGSPAYEKGIQSGDEIVSINGNSSGDLKAYRKLLKQEGKKASVILRNDQGEREYLIEIKRLL